MIGTVLIGTVCPVTGGAVRVAGLGGGVANGVPTPLGGDAILTSYYLRSFVLQRKPWAHNQT